MSWYVKDLLCLASKVLHLEFRTMKCWLLYLLRKLAEIVIIAGYATVGASVTQARGEVDAISGWTDGQTHRDAICITAGDCNHKGQ